MKNEPTANDIRAVMAALGRRNKGKPRPGLGMGNPEILAKCQAGRAAYVIRRRAEKAAALPTRNSLQIYVATVIAGFRGMYRDRADALDTWLRANGQLIRLSSDRPKVPALGPDVPGAPPLLGKSSLMWAILLAALASAALIVTAWGAWYLT